MIVCPIVFSAESRSVMTFHSRRILDDSRGLMTINPKFDKLITSFKSAQFEDSQSRIYYRKMKNRRVQEIGTEYDQNGRK